MNDSSDSPAEITLVTEEGKATLRWWLKLGLPVLVETHFGKWYLLTFENRARWLDYLDNPQSYHEKSSERRFRLAP